MTATRILGGNNGNHATNQNNHRRNYDNTFCSIPFQQFNNAAAAVVTANNNAPPVFDNSYPQALPLAEYQFVPNEIIVSPTSIYKVLQFMGKGTFGQVVKCWRLTYEDGSTDANNRGASAVRQMPKLNRVEIVALKILKCHPSYERQAQTEAAVLGKLSREGIAGRFNVVQPHEFFRHKGHSCLVFEGLDINLYEYLKMNQFKPVQLEHVRMIAHQVLVALAKLKSLGLIHADLKPENIMLVDSVQRPFRVKVIDFGSACFVSNVASNTYLQSRYYRAPEVILGLNYNEAIDMWSLGCVLAELFLGWPLYPGASEYDQIRYIVQTQGIPSDKLLKKANKTRQFFEQVPLGGYHGDQRCLPEAAAAAAVAGTPKQFRWSLKTPDAYERETGVKPKETRKYVMKSLKDLQMIGAVAPLEHNFLEINCHKADKRSFVNMLESILHMDGQSRMTPLEALGHPFITLSHLREIGPSRLYTRSRIMLDSCLPSAPQDLGELAGGQRLSGAANMPRVVDNLTSTAPCMGIGASHPSTAPFLQQGIYPMPPVFLDFPQHLHQQPQVPMSYAFPQPVPAPLPVHSSFHLGSLMFTSAPAAVVTQDNGYSLAAHNVPLVPSNQLPLNQQPLNQQPLNQQPLNQQPLNQQPLNQQPLNQQPLNQQPLNQQPLNQQPFNQQPLNQQPLNQQPLNQQPLNQQPLNQQPMNQQPLNQQPLNQQPLNQQPLNQQPSNADRQVAGPRAAQVFDSLQGVGAAIQEVGRMFRPACEESSQQNPTQQQQHQQQQHLNNTRATVSNARFKRGRENQKSRKGKSSATSRNVVPKVSNGSNNPAPSRALQPQNHPGRHVLEWTIRQPNGTILHRPFPWHVRRNGGSNSRNQPVTGSGADGEQPRDSNNNNNNNSGGSSNNNGDDSNNNNHDINSVERTVNSSGQAGNPNGDDRASVAQRVATSSSTGAQNAEDKVCAGASDSQVNRKERISQDSGLGRATLPTPNSGSASASGQPGDVSSGSDDKEPSPGFQDGAGILTDAMRNLHMPDDGGEAFLRDPPFERDDGRLLFEGSNRTGGGWTDTGRINNEVVYDDPLSYNTPSRRLLDYVFFLLSDPETLDALRSMSAAQRLPNPPSYSMSTSNEARAPMGHANGPGRRVHHHHPPDHARDNPAPAANRGPPNHQAPPTTEYYPCRYQQRQNHYLLQQRPQAQMNQGFNQAPPTLLVYQPQQFQPYPSGPLFNVQANRAMIPQHNHPTSIILLSPEGSPSVYSLSYSGNLVAAPASQAMNCGFYALGNPVVNQPNAQFNPQAVQYIYQA